MLGEIFYYLKITLFVFLCAGICNYSIGDNPYCLFVSPGVQSVKDTIFDLSNIKVDKPNDSVVPPNIKKSKLLSKEGIVLKQYAHNSNNILTDTFIKSTESKNKNNNDISKSLINNVFQNKNLTEEPPVNLFSQLTDKKSLSKQEFLNTVKQLNQLKKEIYKKAEHKKANPVRWLILFIAAILIVVVLAFFIKEIFTLVLIAFMLVALVLLIGFL